MKPAVMGIVCVLGVYILVFCSLLRSAINARLPVFAYDAAAAAAAAAHIQDDEGWCVAL